MPQGNDNKAADHTNKPQCEAECLAPVCIFDTRFNHELLHGPTVLGLLLKVFDDDSGSVRVDSLKLTEILRIGKRPPMLAHRRQGNDTLTR